ncbi:hypothetical protein B0H10DRAFT_1946854 [Mycena sp. CBHHK59/15]|nr:hypothetical protein B0H10DRAFT_1946854 [Mycena sp. CBHHK59/15]
MSGIARTPARSATRLTLGCTHAACASLVRATPDVLRTNTPRKSCAVTYTRTSQVAEHAVACTPHIAQVAAWRTPLQAHGNSPHVVAARTMHNAQVAAHACRRTLRHAGVDLRVRPCATSTPAPAPTHLRIVLMPRLWTSVPTHWLCATHASTVWCCALAGVLADPTHIRPAVPPSTAGTGHCHATGCAIARGGGEGHPLVACLNKSSCENYLSFLHIWLHRRCSALYWSAFQNIPE